MLEEEALDAHELIAHARAVAAQPVVFIGIFDVSISSLFPSSRIRFVHRFDSFGGTDESRRPCIRSSGAATFSTKFSGDRSS